MELNPRYVQARDWYALFYLQLSEGWMAEGVAQARLALKSDPLSSYAHAIWGMTSGCAGKHAEAVQAAQRAVELDSESYLARVIHQGTWHWSGQFEESISAGESALAISGRHWWALAFVATSFAEMRKPAEPMPFMRKCWSGPVGNMCLPAPLAMAAAAAAREEETLHHAREAFENQDPVRQLLSSSRHISHTVPGYMHVLASARWSLGTGEVTGCGIDRGAADSPSNVIMDVYRQADVNEYRVSSRVATQNRPRKSFGVNL